MPRINRPLFFTASCHFKTHFMQKPFTAMQIVLVVCTLVLVASLSIMNTNNIQPLPSLHEASFNNSLQTFYEIQTNTKQHQSWSAKNIANKIHLAFEQHALTLSPLTKTDNWQLGFKLVDTDNLQDPRTPSKPTVGIIYNKIEFTQDRFSEWYINTRHGIEHGYTINSLVETDRKQASFNIQVSGNIRVIERSGELQFMSPTGTIVSKYSHLKVFDADNKPVLARMAYNNNIITISVDTSGARFPITVDPIVSFPAVLVGPNQPAAEMGIDVDGVGDLNGDGIDDVVVGIHGHDNGEGAIQVYLGSNNGLVTPPLAENWFIQKNVPSAQFGNAVSGAGDIDKDGYSDLIVGSYVYSLSPQGNPSEEGAIYIYYGSPTGLTREQEIIGDQAGGHLGHSVGNVGDVNGDGFNDVIASAARYSGLQASSGRVYIYFGSASGVQPVPWYTEIDQANVLFGASVNGAGDVNGDTFDDIVIGAPFYDYTATAVGTTIDMGAAFLYLGSQSLSGGASNAAPILIIDSDTVSNAQAGVSVDGAGDINQDSFPDIIVGAHTYTDVAITAVPSSGAAFTFRGPFTGPTTPNGGFPFQKFLGTQLDEEFGYSVAGAGDVNADGFPDVAISAFLHDADANNNNEGIIFIAYGSATGLRTDNISFGLSNPLQATSLFGIAIRAAGDINNDGYDDIIVGANYFDGPETRQGRAFVFEGRGNSDIGVSLIDSTDPALPNTEVTYTATVSNNGPDPAKRLELASTLPPGATFVSASSVTWSCGATPTNANNIICTLASMDNAATSSVDITVTLSEGSHTFNTTLSANISDPNPINNSDSEITIVSGLPPQNTAPVAFDSSLDIVEDAIDASAQLSANDADQDPLSYEITTSPTLGSITVNNTGLFSYTPGADKNGSDSFKFRVFDGTNYSNPATVSINIAAVQDTPIASNDSFTIDEDITINRLLKYTDPDLQDTLTFQITRPPNLGTITITDSLTGAYNYQPDADLFGDDFFTFSVFDGSATSNSARVDITISPINDAPEVDDKLITVIVGEAKTGSVTGRDIENSLLSFSIATEPKKGSVELISATGEFTYTAYPDSTGVDTFAFTASDGDKTSQPGTVTVVLNTNNAPAPATLISPSDGDTLVSLPATLKWQPAIDPDGDTVSYKVIYCENPDVVTCTPVEVSSRESESPYSTYSTMLALTGPGSGLILLGLMFPAKRRSLKILFLASAISVFLLSCSDAANQAGDPTDSPDDPNISFVINNLNSNATYYWMVVSSDQAGASTDSDVWSFSVGN